MKILKEVLSEDITKDLELLIRNTYKGREPYDEIKDEVRLLAVKYDKLYNRRKGKYKEYMLVNIKKDLLKYVRQVSVGVENTQEDIGVTKLPTELDYETCIRYRDFYSTLTQLEKAIIVEHFYFQQPISAVCDMLSLSFRRVSNIINTYAEKVKEAIK